MARTSSGLVDGENGGAALRLREKIETVVYVDSGPPTGHRPMLSEPKAPAAALEEAAG